MENQYNYFTSDQNMNTENYSTGGNQDQGPKKKHGKGASRWAKVVCTGLVFGVVASAAFQTSNIVAGKVLGTTQKTNKTAKTTNTDNSAKLTTSSNSSSGTANVTEVAKNAMPSIVSITNMSVQEVQNFFQQHLRIRHFSRTGIAAGQVAVGRIHNVESVFPENRHIILRNRIFIHGSVHGRRHQLRTLRRQKNGGEHIVGQTVGRLCHEVGGGRRHADQVRGFRQRDVLHIVFEIPVKGVHRNPVVGQGLKGEGCDEPSGVLGHDDVHIGVLFLQSAGQHGTLICCDAAGNAQQHGFSL